MNLMTVQWNLIVKHLDIIKQAFLASSLVEGLFHFAHSFGVNERSIRFRYEEKFNSLVIVQKRVCLTIRFMPFAHFLIVP